MFRVNAIETKHDFDMNNYCKSISIVPIIEISIMYTFLWNGKFNYDVYSV